MAKITAELRKLVAERSDRRCEYCLIREPDCFFGCEVDHIISLKHGGLSTTDNLAYACALCNKLKGSDLGSLLSPSGSFVRFFNPRSENWNEHFRLDASTITPVTPTGIVTAQILGFNTEDRIRERAELIKSGRYP